MNKAAFSTAGLLLLLNGCVVGPKYQRPAVPSTPSFKEPPPEGWKEAQPKDGLPRGEWWTVYREPALNALETQVKLSNQNVLVAEAQFREAKASVSIARSALFPTLTTSPSFTRSASGNATAGATGRASGVRGLYAVPFDLDYQVDVWGSIRRGVKANSDLAQASAADLNNAQLLYQAGLASDYFQVQGLDATRQLLEATVKSYEQYLQLTQDRLEGGVATKGDVALAQTQLETARAQLVDVGVQRAQFEHAIAVLEGKAPAELTIPAASKQSTPPAVPVLLPSELVERRPDVAAAERQVAAANEQIGIAKAAYYPTLSFSAGAGSQASAILDLFTWPSRFWSIGPQLLEPLFDAGKRRAQVRLTQAAYDATVANYRQTVLTAFQQVEDSLAQLRILADESSITDRAIEAAQQSLAISTIQYRGGLANYLQVITAQTSLLQNQRTAVNINTRRMAGSVGLIEALGGGWNSSQIPAPRDLR